MNHNCLGSILGNDRGVALLITLSIIAILLTVSLELNRRVRIGILAAETGKTDYQLMEIATSGLNVAMALLVKDAEQNQIDTVQEEWSDPEALDKIIASLGFDAGNMTVKITDEMGKIQVNALINEYPGHEVNPDQRQIWENLLSFFISSDKSEDQRDPQEIINCLIDWLDDKDGETITGISGAESPYYNALKIPYKCANRQFFDLNELLFVKGISDTLLVTADNFDTLFADVENQENQNKELQLKDIFTVFGAEKNTSGAEKKYRFSGKINMNTAPVQVIAALLPFGKQDLAESISDYRRMKPDGDSGFTNDLSIKDWYAGIAGLTKKETAALAKRITYSSDLFSMESHARLNGRSLVLTRVVKRQQDKTGKWFCKTLRQQIE
ncbi:type II secretion system protein GspK [Desulfobacula sp.]|uniref:general secretion pathway protein GspK n=1 Tax=Desulfobacula sp. TaxID=2593537 RepID=UPI00262051BF|nr:type II secretion system protein GspK [Desulfobacula sp.]